MGEFKKFAKRIDSFFAEKNSFDMLFINTYFHGLDSLLYRARIYKEKDGDIKFQNHNKSAFNGYNSKESFVKLEGRIIEGRCNKTTRCLYCSSDEDTCCEEIGFLNCKEKYCSIAKIQKKNTVQAEKLIFITLAQNVSCCYTPQEADKIKNVRLLEDLFKVFSDNYPNKRCAYKICQYFGKKAIENNITGVIYRTAKLKCFGDNYAIFDYDKFEPVSSYLRNRNGKTNE